MSGTIERLTGELGRSPTIAEIAKELEDHAGAGARGDGGGVRVLAPCRCPPARRRRGADPIETIGDEDAEFERSEDRAALEPALERLPDREQEILRMRFEEGLTADSDRPAVRHLADARLPPDQKVPFGDARGASARPGVRDRWAGSGSTQAKHRVKDRFSLGRLCSGRRFQGVHCRP